jgi:hypothetical protein
MQYHPTCVRAGAPFTIRSTDKWIRYPPYMSPFHFVCELCTTRDNVGRELTLSAADFRLLALELIQLIESVHVWGDTTID